MQENGAEHLVACTGCQRCEINCTLTNDGVCSSYISRVKIQRRLNLDGAGNGLLSGNDNCFVYFPDTYRQPRDRQVVQVHRLRCLRGRLPVRRSVHRGLGCRHQRSTGCLHGPVRRNNNG